MTNLKLLSKFALTTLASVTFLFLHGCGDLSAGGPATGGTGPFPLDPVTDPIGNPTDPWYAGVGTGGTGGAIPRPDDVLPIIPLPGAVPVIPSAPVLVVSSEKLIAFSQYSPGNSTDSPNNQGEGVAVDGSADNSNSLPAAPTTPTDRPEYNTPKSDSEKTDNDQRQPSDGLAQEFDIKLLDKSPDGQVCGNFVRQITLTQGESFSNAIDMPISVQTQVKNTATIDDSETQYGCSSYRVSNSAGEFLYFDVEGCQQDDSKTLLFEADQEALYKLDLSNMVKEGKYRVWYSNRADSDNLINSDNTGDGEFCQTYVDIQVTPILSSKASSTEINNQQTSSEGSLINNSNSNSNSNDSNSVDSVNNNPTSLPSSINSP